jgi:bacteriocin-like protein
MSTKQKTKAKRKTPKDAREMTEKDLDQVSGGAITVKQKVVEHAVGEMLRIKIDD